MIRGVSVASQAFASSSSQLQGRFYSRFARNVPKEIVPGAWRLNRGYWRLAQFGRREFATCSESDCIPSAAFLLRQQRLLSGYAFRTYVTEGADLISNSYARQGLSSRKEGLLRISASCSRSFSDEPGKSNQAAAVSSSSSSVENGGDGEKGAAEHILASHDSGGEEGDEEEGEEADESGEGQSMAKPSIVDQDERSREREKPHYENQNTLFLAQKARFKKLFEKRVVRWEDLNVTFEEFPHYLRWTLLQVSYLYHGHYISHMEIALFRSSPFKDRKAIFWSHVLLNDF